MAVAALALAVNMEKARELGARRKARVKRPRRCMASTVVPSTISKDTLVTSAKKGGLRHSLRVLYVHSRIDLDHKHQGPGKDHPETGVRACLKKACLAHNASLGFMLFEELELEDPGLLEAFYTAGELTAPLPSPPHPPFLIA